MNSMISYLIPAAALLWTGCGAQKTMNSQTISVRIASKEDSAPFMKRLVTSSGRIIVGTPESARTAEYISIPEGQSLFSAEFIHAPEKALKNEIFRSDRTVLFLAEDIREAQSISDGIEEFAHSRKIDTSSINDPTPNLNQTIWTVSESTPSIHIAIDPAQMKMDLESLSGARSIQVGGQTVTISDRQSAINKKNARTWLKENYERLGYTVTEHPYRTGINLVAEKKSKHPVDQNILIVSGHLDTVRTAGADDDGSGIISSLTVARALANTELNRTIQFVAFDEEEKGLVGSTAYAAELTNNKTIDLVSLFNIEMTGYDSDNDGAIHIIDCNENSSATLTASLTKVITDQQIALKKIDACTDRSDHAAFWEHNRPAIVVSQNFFGGDGNPCYHKSCDTVQKINWDYMAKITTASANAIARMNQ